MADCAVAEVDGVRGCDQHLAGVRNCERNKEVGAVFQRRRKQWRNRSDEALEIGTRMVVMDKGTVAWEGTPQDASGYFNDLAKRAEGPELRA